MAHLYGTRLAKGNWLLAERGCAVTVLLALCHLLIDMGHDSPIWDMAHSYET